MELKAEILDLLERAYEEQQAFAAGLSDEERAAPGTPEQWAARDLVAHVVTWQERLAHNIHAASRGETPPAVGDVDQANAEIFEQHRNRPWEDILAYAARAVEVLAETVRAMRDDDLLSTQTLPWQRNRPLWRTIVGTGYVHPLSHLTQYYAEHGQAGRGAALSEEAARRLAQLDDSPDWRGTVQYNLACYYALAGQHDSAMEALCEALHLAPDLTEWSKQDTDLVSLRERPDYQSLYGE